MGGRKSNCGRSGSLFWVNQQKKPPIFGITRSFPKKASKKAKSKQKKVLRLRLQEDFCFPLTKPPSQRPEIRDGVLGLVPPLCVSFLLARPEETLQKERKQSRFSPPPSSPSPRNAAAPVSPLPIHPIMSPRFLLISCSTSVSS